MRFYPLLVLWALPVFAQQAPAEATDAKMEETDPTQKKAAKSSIKPYADVIPSDSQTDDGVFRVHKVREKWFFEIPAHELGREFLLVATLARSAPGLSFGGQRLSDDTVRWERIGERVLLRKLDYSSVADPNHPIAISVARSRNGAVLKSFPIQALGEGDAPVIEVSGFFASEITEMSPRSRLGAKGFDKDRSFVQSVRSYPINIEVDASQTYTKPIPDRNAPRPNPSPTPPRRGPFAESEMAPGSATVGIRFSMVRLPDEPMQPRLHDERVGFFKIDQTDYSREEHKAAQRSYIARWRLEKADPAADLSEPVKPIVFYIDPATPAKWVPHIKRGVEAWRPAFEQAGFLNAIEARDAPSPNEDPEWSGEDARYSVIRWISSEIQNAYGPHVSDPRSGEILESDIGMFHNVLRLIRNWYFVQVSPLDPRAQKLPLPDDLMGRLVEYVASHEVGHTLGLPHNMKSSSLYPFEKVRDPEWVRENSHVATLMDYSRFNYVAQPEDGIAVEDLVPKIGPYDRFAIRWGYTPIPGAADSDAEKETLHRWIVEAQEATPWLRFSSTAEFGVDPGAIPEAVGDADPIQATTLGLKNLKRVLDSLLVAVPRDGEPYDELLEIYEIVLGQWVREMRHVAVVLGGYDAVQKRMGQAGVLFTPVSRERQAAAVEFLIEKAFAKPDMFLDPEILRRIEPVGALERLREAQGGILDQLLDEKRMIRLFEQQAVDGGGYSAFEMLTNLREGLFVEVRENEPIDDFRRNLQRRYVELLIERFHQAGAALDDRRALLRNELEQLAALGALPHRDEMTRLHLRDLKARVERGLDPAFQPPARPSGSRPGVAGEQETWCWPELRFSLDRELRR